MNNDKFVTFFRKRLLTFQYDLDTIISEKMKSDQDFVLEQILHEMVDDLLDFENKGD